MKPVELTVVDTNTATWELFPVAYIGANLEHVPLMSDPETGMMILKMVYRAGFTNPWHSHPCAHGVYVLDGTLSTHQGRYPAGSFVWFPCLSAPLRTPAPSRPPNAGSSACGSTIRSMRRWSVAPTSSPKRSQRKRPETRSRTTTGGSRAAAREVGGRGFWLNLQGTLHGGGQGPAELPADADG
jgi:ChrR Cupin-like domain